MTRPTTLFAATLAVALLAPGCRALGTGGGTGAAIGSAVGAGAGYAIGDHNGEKWAGTAIGALAGGLAGWFIGDAVEPATHERPIEGPAVHRVEHAPAPAIPDDRPRTVVVRHTEPVQSVRAKRVIIRDIYPDGTVRERVVPLPQIGRE